MTAPFVLRVLTAREVLRKRSADPAEHTAPAGAVFLSRFEREVDPDGVLDPQDRARRAEHAKKAYFIKLALASRKARAAKRRANTTGSPDAGNDDGGQA